MIRSTVQQSVKNSMRLARAVTRSSATSVSVPRYISTVRCARKQQGLNISKRPSLQLRYAQIQIRGYAEIVKVPDMAESITEGTLKSFEKGTYLNEV